MQRRSKRCDSRRTEEEDIMRSCRMRAFACLLLGAVVALSANLAEAGSPAPSGRAAMAWHVTIAPSWFDPSTAPPQITPFGMLYAIHDALVRPRSEEHTSD